MQITQLLLLEEYFVAIFDYGETLSTTSNRSSSRPSKYLLFGHYFTG